MPNQQPDKPKFPPPNKRYACLTNEQQDLFNTWNPRQRAYCLYRAKGYSVKESYLLAGFKSKDANQSAYKLEHNTCKGMTNIIETLQNGRKKMEELTERGPVTKALDKKLLETVPAELEVMQVPKDSAYVMDTKPLDVDSLSYDQANNIKFYRQIANGTIKTVKVTKNYDADGKLIGKKVEETSDLETRIKAQKEVMRLTGTIDVLEIGQVKAQDINIMIVDASRRSDMVDERDKHVNKPKKEDIVYVEEKQEDAK